MNCVYRSVKMAVLQLIFLIGCIYCASGQVQGQSSGSDMFGDTNTYIDPFMADRCTSKGIDLQEILRNTQTCSKDATLRYLTRIGGIRKPSEAFTLMCRLGEPLDDCLDDYIAEVKQCYDTKEEKKDVESVSDVTNAVLNYMCEDNGKRMIEAFSDLDSVFCMTKIHGGGRRDYCLEREKAGIFAPNGAIQNEETCLAAFHAGRCYMEPLKDCSNRKAYNYIRGLTDAAMRASPCGKYLGHLLSSATVPASNLWILLSLSVILLMRKI